MVNKASSTKPLCGNIDPHLCMGCGICAGICPQNALEMILDEGLGVYMPDSIEDKCNECGLCRKVCPGYSTDLESACLQLWGVIPRNKRLGHYQTAVSSYSLDSTIRYNASSGGMVTALLTYMLEKKLITGALVTRMRTDIPWMPESFIATTPEEVTAAAGSKYCPVALNKGLKQIVQNEGRYAIVGLPCHIYGIRNAQRLFTALRQRIVLTLGLFCAGGRSFKGTEAFLSQTGHCLEDVRSLKYRGGGWPGQTNIMNLSGRSIKCSIEVAYPFMCMNDVNRCAFCPDKTSELADMSFGDLWLANERPRMGAGKSVCIVRSPSGAELLNQTVTERLVSASALKEHQVVATADVENKKRLAAAKFTVSMLLGNPVPSINFATPNDYNFLDLMRALQYLTLQKLCRHNAARQAFFRLKPKYRKLRKAIEYQ
jgi:coenzyme F420 hydrogenase subunit beta